VFARNVRAERARLGLTQSELAERLGWLQVTVSALETGRRAVQLDDIPALCRALGVSVEQLIMGADPADLNALGLDRTGLPG
jgi:transcriptional regulator with XRE-family HTH domain